jgi:ATP-dependent DNA helicase RecG
MTAIKSYTDAELLALLDDIESDRVERKESFKGDVPDRARQAVCAFANDLPNHKEPGILFIGAKDNGEIVGLPISDELLLQLADMKSDGNILPLPVLTVEKRILKGMEIAVITVIPSDMPPVKYKGRIWIRTGPRRAIANEQEERILNEKRRYNTRFFDMYPVLSASLSDLSKTIFEGEFLPAAFAEDVLADNHRTYEERLASCKMILSPDDTTPTTVGILTLGKTPQDFFPGACIQFLRIDGCDPADPVIDEAKLIGTIIDMMRRAEEKLMAHNRTAYDVTSAPAHIITQDYPPTALQQILYNAVMHRTYEGTNAPVRIYWYDDRIEIISPGGPYGNVTSENFGNFGITDYRNPNIADVLKTVGLIQGFGKGIMIVKSAMKRNGNPPPEFTANQSIVACTLRKRI